MPAALAGIGSNDDAAVRHRHRTIAHVVNHVRIVADQHHRQIARLFQLVEQVEDLRLHRHVNAEVGSSSNSSFGRSNNARTIATR